MTVPVREIFVKMLDLLKPLSYCQYPFLGAIGWALSIFLIHLVPSLVDPANLSFPPLGMLLVFFP